METIEAEVTEQEIPNILELRPVVSYDNDLSKFVTNIADMKIQVKAGLVHYDYEVTEDTYKDAKAHVTELNKFEKSIADTRKSLAMKFDTWKSINTSIMEVEKLIKAQSTKLKKGMEVFDIKAEQEKRAMIRNYWNSLDSGIDYSLVDNPAFKNVGYTEKKWKEELDNKYQQILKEREFVGAMLNAKTEFTETERQQVFKTYNDTIDQTRSLNKIVEIEEAKARAKAVAEAKKLEEEKRAQEQAYIQQVKEEEHREATLSEASNMTNEEPIWTLNLVMVGNKEAFREFLKQTNFFEIAEQNGIVIKEKKWSK